MTGSFLYMDIMFPLLPPTHDTQTVNLFESTRISPLVLFPPRLVWPSSLLLGAHPKTRPTPDDRPHRLGLQVRALTLPNALTGLRFLFEPVTR